MYMFMEIDKERVQRFTKPQQKIVDLLEVKT